MCVKELEREEELYNFLLFFFFFFLFQPVLTLIFLPGVYSVRL